MSTRLDGLIALSKRRPKGSVAPDVLDCLISELTLHGSAPMASTIAERLGMTPQMVTRAMRQLMDGGLVAQPYGDRGPYVPIQRSDGTPIRLEVIDVEPRHDTLHALLDQLPAAKREAAEAYLRFLIEQG